MKLKFQLALVLSMILATFGCIHKAGGATVTAYEKAVTYSDMLAQTNNSIAKGVIAAQQQGLLTVAQTTTLLAVQQKIALDHKALTQILQAGTSTATSQATQVQNLLNDIRASINSLDFQSAGLGIKNPNSQQTFANDANTIFSFTDVILASLTSAGVIK